MSNDFARALLALKSLDSDLQQHRLAFLFGRLVAFKRGSVSVNNVAGAVRSALAQGVSLEGIAIMLRSTA